MKRQRSHDDEPTEKRARTDSDVVHADDADADPFRPTLQRKAVDVCEHGSDGDGFIQATVRMRWPKKPELVLEAVENGQAVSFDVKFADPCWEYLTRQGAAFTKGDQLYISLKGAKVIKRLTSRLPKLPMELKYEDSVRIKFLATKSSPPSGTVVDSWAALPAAQSSKPPKARNGPSTGDAPLGDDWFATPAMPAPTATPSTSEGQQQTTSTVLAEKYHAHVRPSQDSLPAVQDPVPPEPALEASSSNSPAPAQQPVPAAVPAPPKTIYRNMPGRAGNGNAKANGKKRAQGNSKASSEAPSPAPPAPPTSGDSAEAAPPAEVTSKSKKAQKKIARAARKAGATAQENAILPSVPPVQQEPQPEAATSVPSSRSASSGPRPEAITSVDASVPSESVAGPSSAVPSVKVATPVPATPSTTPAKQSIPPPIQRPTPRTSTATPSKRPSMTGASAVASTSAQENPELNLQAGCHGENGTVYIPLNDLRPGHGQSLIGVIVSIGKDSKTSTAEVCRKFVVVDPSNVEPEDLHRGFSITMFAKYASSLPTGKRGDVLVLEHIQIVEFHGKINAVCASYAAWAWMVFVPESGATVRDHDRRALGQAELRYCIALGDWWRAVQREQERALRNRNVVVHQIADDDAPQWGGRPSYARVHRLIRDAGPDVQPNGYFDCTVEVLHGHTNNFGPPYSLYVTDYTKNDALAPTTAAWCPPALAPYVLRLELWDDAAARGPEMRAREFYELGNVRMKASRSGYVEAKFVEVRKMRKLDEDELEGEPHLAALLERKKKWEDESEKNGAHKFPHQLISEAQLDSHFCCTLEILRVSKKDDDRALLFATDYTSRTDLAPIAATADWTRGVSADRIVKIGLQDEQTKAAGELRAGDVVAVRNLRLKAIAEGRNVAGVLGGFDRLIFKLNPVNSGNEECLALMSRKSAYERRAQEKRPEPQKVKTAANGRKITKAPAAVPKKAAQGKISTRSKGAVMLSEILGREYTKLEAFRVVARVVDYSPVDIEDFVVLYCTNCKRNIPKAFRICTKCDSDMADTYMQPFYRFWFEIEDEEGTRSSVTVTSPMAPFLPDFISDLEPVDFHEDDEALERFKDHLRPYIGNDLVDRHSELVAATEDEICLKPSDSPWLNFRLLVTTDDKPTLVVVSCTAVH